MMTANGTGGRWGRSQTQVRLCVCVCCVCVCVCVCVYVCVRERLSCKALYYAVSWCGVSSCRPVHLWQEYFGEEEEADEAQKQWGPA